MEKNTLEQAKKNIELGKYNTAKKILKKLIKSNEKIKAMLELGKLKWQIGNIVEAKNYFHKILTIDSNNGSALLELGKIALFECDFIEAKNYFEKIINTNNDQKIINLAILEYGKLEASKRNFEQAKKYYQKLIDSHAWNSDYALLELMSLEIQLKNYYNAYKYFNELACYTEILPLDSIKKIQFYIKYQLGVLRPKDIKNNNNYFCRQIISYKAKRAIHCIRVLNSSKNTNTIYNNISINNLFKIVKKHIKKEVPIYSNTVDKYRFTFQENIGTIRGIDTNAIEVITIANTKNIINICPIPSSPHFPKINDRSLFLQNKKEKQLVLNSSTNLSQIDKFCRRYNLQ